MENYKKSLKLDLVLNIVITIVLIALTITYFALYNINPINDFSKGFQFGIAIAGYINLIMSYYTIIKQLRNPTYARKKYIEKNDDREILISHKVMTLSGKILIMLMFIAMFVSLYFSMTVFYTLLITNFIYCMVIVIVRIIYSKLN